MGKDKRKQNRRHRDSPESSPPPPHKTVLKEKREPQRSPSISEKAAALSLENQRRAGRGSGYDYAADERQQERGGESDGDMSQDEADAETDTTHVSRSFRIGILESQVAAISHCISKSEEIQQKTLLKVEANMSHFQNLKSAWDELNKARPIVQQLSQVLQISSDKRCLVIMINNDAERKNVTNMIKEKLHLTNAPGDKLRVLPYTPPGKGAVSSAAAVISKQFRVHMESLGKVHEVPFGQFKMDYPDGFCAPDFFMTCENEPILHGRLNRMGEMEIFFTRKVTCGQLTFRGNDFISRLEVELKKLQNYPFPFKMDTTDEQLQRPSYFAARDGKGKGKGLSSIKGGGKGKSGGGRS
jgi:hypothetical protein